MIWYYACGTNSFISTYYKVSQIPGSTQLNMVHVLSIPYSLNTYSPQNNISVIFALVPKHCVNMQLIKKMFSWNLHWKTSSGLLRSLDGLLQQQLSRESRPWPRIWSLSNYSSKVQKLSWLYWIQGQQFLIRLPNLEAHLGFGLNLLVVHCWFWLMFLWSLWN